jgi:hypothetical protein
MPGVPRRGVEAAGDPLLAVERAGVEGRAAVGGGRAQVADDLAVQRWRRGVDAQAGQPWQCRSTAQPHG